MPGAASLIGLFLRYLWPFIREWFFDKRTATKWLKKNSVAICFTVCFFFIAYSSFKILMYAVDQKHLAMDTVLEHKETTQRLEDAQRDVARLTADTANTLESQKALELDLKTSNEKIERYEFWMRSCGMDYTHVGETLPRCKTTTVIAQAPRPARRPVVRPPRAAPSTPPRSDISERVRDIWSQSK